MYLFDNIFAVILALSMTCMFVAAVIITRSRGRNALFAQATRVIRENVKMSAVNRGFLSSMKAEELLEKILYDAGWQHVFLRRRVKVARLGHNREIDVIAVGPVILVIEVKNWQGYVWSNGTRWFQKCSATFNKTLEFEDVEADNVEKAAAVRRYIENTCRIPLPDFVECSKSEMSGSDANMNSNSTSLGTWYSNKDTHTFCGKCVIPVVVFTNRKVKLDPTTIKRRELVFTLEEFHKFAASVYKQALIYGYRSYGINNRDTERSNVICYGKYFNKSISNYNSNSKHGRKSVCLQSVKRFITDSCCTRVLIVLQKIKYTPHRLYNIFVGQHDKYAKWVDQRYLLNSSIEQKVSDAINAIRTWDLFYLHNGQLFTGDVQSVELCHPLMSIERKHIVNMQFEWNTGWQGVMRAILANQKDQVHITLLPSAWQGRSRKKQKQLILDDSGNVRLSVKLNSHSSKNTDKLVIKTAGTQELQYIDLNNIKEIHLSQHHLF